ncbi:hypothetical protein FRC04_006986 [Tulasnella sp. 424]|nr:hypothetical protein FRC04_006986 [Tulasnella sp. 424]
MDLNQGAKVKLDRLTLGPDADHWGVYRASDGSFQTFSSVGTRDKLTRLLGWKTDKIESSNQIGFVALGFAGDWAFSVNGQAKYRCSKPFQKEFSDGLKAQKRVSTVVLSSMARLWIIVWEDGTLSHNLPSKLAGQVKVYCQLKHSLKVNGIQSNSGRPKAPKVKPPRNIPRAPTTPPQKQQPTPQDTITGDTPGSSENTTQPLARDVSPTTNQQRNTASAFGSQTLPAPPPGEATADTVPVPKAPIPSVFCSSQQSVTGPLPAQPPTVPHISKAPAVTQLATQVPRTSSRPQQTPWILSSQADRAISRVETIFGKPLIYGPTKKLSTTLRQLDPTDWNDSYEYNKISRLFQDGWNHRYKKCPNIKRILVVSLPDHLNESYREHKDDLERRYGWSGINERLLFHGTTRSCSLGEGEGYSSLCEMSSCRLCSILRTSFLVSKARSAGLGTHRYAEAAIVAVKEQSGNRIVYIRRSGPGIYTSSLSSNADDCSRTPPHSPHTFLIVAKAALGKNGIQYQSLASLTRPPLEYDSVPGEVGLGLNYDEQVLYKNEAVRPAYVIIYERPTSALTDIGTAAAPIAQPNASNTTRPAATQNYRTYNPFQATTLTSTTPTTKSSSSNRCIIM